MGFSSSPREAFQSQAAVTFGSIPVILGMPSNLGTGRVIIKPWAVPTHSSPWQMRRLVTRMLFWPAAWRHNDTEIESMGRLHEIIETATVTDQDHPSRRVNNELLLILISPSIFFQDNADQKDELIPCSTWGRDDGLFCGFFFSFYSPLCSCIKPTFCHKNSRTKKQKSITAKISKPFFTFAHINF